LIQPKQKKPTQEETSNREKETISPPKTHKALKKEGGKEEKARRDTEAKTKG
jgi:hypothetical protein